MVLHGQFLVGSNGSYHGWLWSKGASHLGRTGQNENNIEIKLSINPNSAGLLNGA